MKNSGSSQTLVHTHSKKPPISTIYAGKLDARDEVSSPDGERQFLNSFLVSDVFPYNRFLNGEKYIVQGDKGTGKTSVLYYLEYLVGEESERHDLPACTSFIYFKGDFEDFEREYMQLAAQKLAMVIDTGGQIISDEDISRLEYLHIWRWIFFKKIVEDAEAFSQSSDDSLFVEDNNWNEFVNLVKNIDFSSDGKKVLLLSSLSVNLGASLADGLKADAGAKFEVAKDSRALEKLTLIVDRCEALYESLVRTNVPYFIFVDEVEAYQDNIKSFERDLMLIRDLIRTIHRINRIGQVRIVAAVRNEVLDAISRYVSPKELNKITEGFGQQLKWSYNNDLGKEHPIIKILMRRISISCNREQQFYRWFPKYIDKAHQLLTTDYILNRGWSKPRDVVRFLIVAQDDAQYSKMNYFSQKALESFEREYSNRCLQEIRETLQPIYHPKVIDMIINMVRGGSRFLTREKIEREFHNRAPKQSAARSLWDDITKRDDLIQDFYRAGFWGCVLRRDEKKRRLDKSKWRWGWYHKGSLSAIFKDDWELVIHSAFVKSLKLSDEE